MEAKAYLYDVRIAPRKVKIVLDLIRGKDVEMAAAILKNTPKRGADITAKILKSAVANAENNLSLNKENLFVKEARIDEGRVLKRMKFEDFEIWVNGAGYDFLSEKYIVV